ncbi:hypothetical protein CEXT_606031 [Caerostris extrusa]|uniref:Uncharacterized protein n=1 Tax=Caerostris extrusa TaxID=172846 RepID=A0AAV4PYH2_CAEEX|nr:hypothetical protein CEXT_606031 [Caerostris extrusa]
MSKRQKRTSMQMYQLLSINHLKVNRLQKSVDTLPYIPTLLADIYVEKEKLTTFQQRQLPFPHWNRCRVNPISSRVRFPGCETCCWVTKDGITSKGDSTELQGRSELPVTAKVSFTCRQK